MQYKIMSIVIVKETQGSAKLLGSLAAWHTPPLLTIGHARNFRSFILVLLVLWVSATIVSNMKARLHHVHLPKYIPYIPHLVMLLAHLFKLAMLLALLFCSVWQELTVVSVISNGILIDHDTLLAIWRLRLASCAQLRLTKVEVWDLVDLGLSLELGVELIDLDLFRVQHLNLLFIFGGVVLLYVWGLGLVDLHRAVAILLVVIQVDLIPLQLWVVLVQVGTCA
jgi:hypothetical protein